MTAISIAGMGLTGVLRITWVHDNLAHVLDHSHTDETSGTWTGLACPGHGLALGTDVDDATLQRLAAGNEIADLAWEAPDELAAEHAQASTTPALTAFPVPMSTTSSSPVIDRWTKARYVGSVRRWWPGRGTPVTAVAASPAFATRACFTIVETGCPVPNGRTTVVTGRDWRSGGAPPWSGPPLKPGRAARLGELPMPPEGARP